MRILILFFSLTDPHFVQFVSEASTALQGRVARPTPNPQPGRPGDHSSSGLYPSTCPAWVILPGALDSCRYSSRGHGDTQAALPLQGLHGEAACSLWPSVPAGAS